MPVNIKEAVMKKILKISALFLVIASLTVFAFSCTAPEDSTVPGDGNLPEPSNDPVNITLSENTISADNTSGLTVSGSVLTVNAPGTYKLSGKLTDGQIIVDTLSKGDVFLVLSGVDIHCSNNAPIYCKQAKNLYIVLEKDTTNLVSDGGSYILPVGEDEPDAAIFSKDDLFIMGEGSLTVTANYNDGITGKDDVNIESGNITVTAANHGIKGKDSLEVKGGSVTVTAAGDGLKSTQDNDATLGFVEIKAGSVKITAGDEGIQAYTNVIISGGDISISSVDSAVKAEQVIDLQGGKITVESYDNSPFSALKVEPSDNVQVTVNGNKFEF